MVAHAAMAALILRVVFPRATPQLRRRILRWWAGKLLRVVGVTIRVEGSPPGFAEHGAMIVANHVSWLDIFAISSVRPTRFIAKDEIRDWPLAGWIVERAGTIFIRPERRSDLARINTLVGSALQQGDCVGLFPEGGTTRGNRLLKFHSSLFEAAVANHAQVLPAAIRYERPDGSLSRQMAFVGELSFTQSLGLVIRQRGVVVRIAFSPVLEVEGVGRRELAKRVEQRVASLLGLSPAGTAPRTAPGLPDAPP
jgi:1-acyl-sn-glycerol-3-phosphate acyltransferase